MRTISVVTPTYNSMRTLGQYMDALRAQDYPREALEVIFADGGSDDGTRERIAEWARTSGLSVSLLENPLRTAEAGKAVGVRSARHDIVCLLDSDNILPGADWLSRMARPFDEERVIASEPIAYTWRAGDGRINRYCALIGMNDPLCLFTGNYDRMCLLTGVWTEVEREEEDRGDYLSVRFRAGMIPTIGANGFLMRRRELCGNFGGDYLFDIDVLWELLQKDGGIRVAKVKTGIVHLFCPDTRTFCRKQNRRIRDFLHFSGKKGRAYPWSRVPKRKIALFALCCLTVLPLVAQAAVGFSRKRDAGAWLFHVPACWLTLWIYGWGTVKSVFAGASLADRTGWRQ